MRHGDWLESLIETPDPDEPWDKEPEVLSKSGTYFYPSRETQWMGFYEVTRIASGVWIAKCNTDGETYTRWTHATVCDEIERHILRGHEPAPVYQQADYSGDPPF